MNEGGMTEYKGTDAGPRVWFVGRHAGALDFARQVGLRVDVVLTHADTLTVAPGDRVYGTLPYWLAARVCEMGGEFWCLEVPLSRTERGRELSADDLHRAGAHFVRYEVRRVA